MELAFRAGSLKASGGEPRPGRMGMQGALVPKEFPVSTKHKAESGKARGIWLPNASRTEPGADTFFLPSLNPIFPSPVNATDKKDTFLLHLPITLAINIKKDISRTITDSIFSGPSKTLKSKNRQQRRLDA